MSEPETRSSEPAERGGNFERTFSLAQQAITGRNLPALARHLEDTRAATAAAKAARARHLRDA